MAGRGGRTRKQAEVPITDADQPAAQEDPQQQKQQQTRKQKQKEPPAVNVDQQAVQDEEEQPQQEQSTRKRKPKKTPAQNSDQQQAVVEVQRPQLKHTRKRKQKDASAEMNGHQQAVVNEPQQAVVNEPQQKRKRKQKETRTDEPASQEGQQYEQDEASASGQQSDQEEHPYSTPAHPYPVPNFMVPSGSSEGMAVLASAALSISTGMPIEIPGETSTAIPTTSAPTPVVLRTSSLAPVTYSSRSVAVSFCSRAPRPRAPRPVHAPESAPEPEPVPAITTNQGGDKAQRENKELKRKVRELENHVKSLRAQLQQLQVTATPRVGTQNRTDQHRRRRGTKLTEDERRAILHMYEMCLQEKENGKSVTTADPILRTAVYFGASQNTVRDAILGRNMEDRRTKAMNLEGVVPQVGQDPSEAVQFQQDAQAISVAHPQFNQFTQVAHVPQVTQVSHAPQVTPVDHVPHITHVPHDPQVSHVPHVTHTVGELGGNVQFPGVWDI